MTDAPQAPTGRLDLAEVPTRVHGPQV